MVSTSATVLRAGQKREIPLRNGAGDIVLLSAGDMVPADVRLISAPKTFISTSLL